MNLQIEKIKLSELEAFVKSQKYQEMEFVPISLHRAKSYLHNPHACPEDVVLYLGFVSDTMVAFRSLFADVAQTGTGSVRFGWCSGSWVHPSHRRKGFSTQLLREAYLDWDKKLMFTNYAPEAEKLNLKTGWFQTVHQFEGIRAYLFPKMGKRSYIRNAKAFWQVTTRFIDWNITWISTLRTSFFKKIQREPFSFKITEFPDKTCFQYLEQYCSHQLFRRFETELNWIFQYPWLTRGKSTPANKYPFSGYSDSFYYRTVKIYCNDEPLGFFIFSVREGHLKTLYYAIPDFAYEAVADFLKNFAVNEKLEVITVYKNELSNLMLKRKFPFLRVKKYGQRIYSTFSLPGSNNFVFQDGDGDVIFT